MIRVYFSGTGTDDYDRVRDDEAREEQARWDEAQDEASRARAEQYEYTEDVP